MYFIFTLWGKSRFSSPRKSFFFKKNPSSLPASHTRRPFHVSRFGEARDYGAAFPSAEVGVEAFEFLAVRVPAGERRGGRSFALGLFDLLFAGSGHFSVFRFVAAEDERLRDKGCRVDGYGSHWRRRGHGRVVVGCKVCLEVGEDVAAHLGVLFCLNVLGRDFCALRVLCVRVGV